MATIHFLNVGHGDCTIIEHNDGNLTMIDINNGSELAEGDSKAIFEGLAKTPEEYRAKMASVQNGWKKWPNLLSEAGYNIQLTNPIEFLKVHYPNRSIFRYIQTHPDFDHLRGLAALESSGIRVMNFWDTNHSRKWNPGKDKESDKPDWDAYQRYRSGNGPTVLNLYRDCRGQYYNKNERGENGGNGLYLLSPTVELLKEFDMDGKRNEVSYVVEYRTANRRIIFGGDAERGAWDSIFRKYGASLKCDILKASHHGRDSGYHQEAVKAMSPTVTIVSVGKKPESDASNKYRAYSGKVWSTRWRGDLTVRIGDDGSWKWTASETKYSD